MWYETIIDRGILPDWALRMFVRQGLKQYDRRVSGIDSNSVAINQASFRSSCSTAPIAINTDEANRQHYGVPAAFFLNFLSTYMKYSGSIWNGESTTLEQSDQSTLETYIERASISDGHEILDLGCGWGALSLQMAQMYTRSQITAVTNSEQQAAFIRNRIRMAKLDNLNIVHANIKHYKPPSQFDRVVSIEMFEHVRDPESVLRHIRSWLRPKGTLFLQVFSHKTTPQHFDNVRGSWMSRHFFTGGMMPYAGFYADICGHLDPLSIWNISGLNYHKTLEAWLDNLKRNEPSALNALRIQSTTVRAKTYLNRYRLFLIFCSELFRYNNGQDWYLMHYLFQN